MGKAVRNGLGVLLVALGLGASAADDDVRARYADEARKAATQVMTQIRAELMREMERTGPIRSIVVCKYSAPEMTSAVSRQTGMRVTRVSLRPRNRALGEPDPWEQQVLLDFEKRLSKGEKIEGLETSEVVTEPAGRFFRYMKAIPVAQPCLACHGPVAAMSEGVKAQLAQEYPHDRAVNYELGQVRGGVSVKRPY
ncbi:MAG TPA: DUF3365 domain-containing protein [Rhodocyclaceae bacterium]|nr:DUF3365 domain-containing protein [Rhodocyclaceae bacterium]